MHKAGFVNIIGNPNVGKSTLMNALVGERLSIIIQSPDHAPPHLGSGQRRRFPDRLLGYAGHSETQLQTPGVDDEIRHRRRERCGT